MTHPEAPAVVGSRELWVEFLHESLWRLLLDWPAAVGLPPAREAFTAWRGQRNDDDAAAATLHVDRCCPSAVGRSLFAAPACGCSVAGEY